MTAPLDPVKRSTAKGWETRRRKAREELMGDPVKRYLNHARLYGMEGVREAAVGDLDDRQLERLRQQLLDQLGIRVWFPRNPLCPRAKSVRESGDSMNGSPAPESVASGRKCAICGKGLGGRHSHANTCSPAHRVELHRRNRRQEAR